MNACTCIHHTAYGYVVLSLTLTLGSNQNGKMCMEYVKSFSLLSLEKDMLHKMGVSLLFIHVFFFFFFLLHFQREKITDTHNREIVNIK